MEGSRVIGSRTLISVNYYKSTDYSFGKPNLTSYKLCKRVWVDVWISAHVSLVAKPPSDVLRQAYVPPLFIFWGPHVLACVNNQLEQAQRILFFSLDSCFFLNIDIINHVHFTFINVINHVNEY